MKESNTAKRLKQIMDEKNLKQIDLLKMTLPYCEQYGVKMNKSDISQYCSGKVEPNQSKLFILGMALNVNEAWLMGFDVPMDRNNYEDQNLLNFDAKLNEALLIIENAGFTWNSSSDDDIIIKNSHNQTILCLQDYELVARYESALKKGKVTVDLLLSASKNAFISYINSLGYYLYTDDPEHRPFMSSKELTCRLNHDTLESLKQRIDTYAKAVIDSDLLALKEEELRLERLKKEKITLYLQNRSNKTSNFQKTYLETQAAHERTDVEMTDEMKQYDDALMDNDDIWK